MKLSRLKHLFSPSRARRLGGCFLHPMIAHMKLTFIGKGNFTLQGKNGLAVTFSRARMDHVFFDWLAQRDDVTLDVSDEGELVIIFNGGRRLFLIPGTSDIVVFTEIFINDTYKLHSINHKIGVVVDIGGNCGLFSCAILEWARQVVTVEALSSNVIRARKNMSNYGGTADHQVLHFAITGQSGGSVSIYYNNFSGNSSLNQNWVVKSDSEKLAPMHEQVSTLNLVDLFYSNNIHQVDLLKCDVEGAEWEIFQAAPDSLLLNIKNLVLEVHFSNGEDFGKFDSLKSRFNSLGFQVQCSAVVDDELIQKVINGKPMVFLMWANATAKGEGSPRIAGTP